MQQVDLHCHSTVSDGLLSPCELVHYAADCGVKVFALTDHDDTDGLDEAYEATETSGVALIKGTEISVTWNNRTIHIVGLKIDPAYSPLRRGLLSLREGRKERARKIAHGLAQAGIAGAWDGAVKCASEAREDKSKSHVISRTHFARFLVANGYVRDMQAAFQRYLGKGRPGHVIHNWAQLGEAVRWITASGGLAVIAHPGRYELSRAALNRLIAEFKEAGGTAMEVVTSGHTPDQFLQFAQCAKENDLFASCGSDYHGPGHVVMGRLPRLPAGCVPIWQDWPDLAA